MPVYVPWKRCGGRRNKAQRNVARWDQLPPGVPFCGGKRLGLGGGFGKRSAGNHAWDRRGLYRDVSTPAKLSMSRGAIIHPKRLQAYLLASGMQTFLNAKILQTFSKYGIGVLMLE